MPLQIVVMTGKKVTNYNGGFGYLVILNRSR